MRGDSPVAVLEVVPQPYYQLRCWGGFALVDQNGVDCAPRGRKARAIVAYLALRPGSKVKREKLADLLWGDRDEERARGSLRQSLFGIRHLSEGAEPLISITRSHVVLHPHRLSSESDVIAARAEAGDLPGLAEMISAGEGDLFADLDGAGNAFDEWLAGERARRRNELLDVARTAAEAGLEKGETGPARTLIATIEALDPLDETTVRLGMVADARAGEAAALERRYLALRDRLSSELGVSPSGETQALHKELLWKLGIRSEEFFAQSGPPHTLRIARHPLLGSLRLRVALAAAVLLAVLVGAYVLFRAVPEDRASIAVLPFRNMAGDNNTYFAEGVSEEILSVLARNPRLQVMGRTSSWTFRDRGLDARTIGARLGVSYLLEGSVRAVGRQLRVNVALVRTSDGMQIWSEQYDRSLNDVFAIQDSIARSVADRIGGGAGGIPRASAMETSGDVYSLYLTARGLLRQRGRARAEAAEQLLRRAVQLDPNYAPAWASLGMAAYTLWNYERRPGTEAAMRREALGYERRALALQPGLAHAHAVIGMILGSRGAEAGAHIRRAVQLDPNNAESWEALAAYYYFEGDLPRQLDGYRRAATIDPLWIRAVDYAAMWSWALGYRDDAIAYFRRLEDLGDPFESRRARSEIARMRGDLSGAVIEMKAALEAADEGERPLATERLGRFLWALGYRDELLRIRPNLAGLLELSRGSLPSPVEFDSRYASMIRDSRAVFGAQLAQRLMLNTGRSRELVRIYDRDIRSPEALLRQAADHTAFIANAAMLAIALREAGRMDDAARLLAVADRAVRARLRRGRVSLWDQAACAQLWAVMGNRSDALSALEQAVDRGWIHSEERSLRDIADEPAFRTLRADPRFQRIRARINAHIERERRELGPIGI